MNDKIQATHIERRAIVYLRQSTLQKVHDNHKSTLRQYALGQRAIELGWPSARVDVIDDDLGRSGTTTEGRTGFQRLANDVAHGQIGAIFVLEVSRLARSSADSHRLLDLCGLADAIIVDEQTVYTPRDPNDRLLLGLKGTMSDAEQYWMRLRLTGGRLNKARRGELHITPPTGYVWDGAAAQFRLDPDEAVQKAVRLVFDRFRIDGSARGVMRYLARQGLQMPALDKTTEAVRWNVPSHCAIRNMLLNPAYAGVYAFGRRESRVGLVDGKARRRVRRLPESEWKICLRDHHPCYIDWDEFLRNQRKLSDNRTKTSESRGPAREGSALLQGLVRCGRCGRRMSVRYKRGSNDVRYECASLASRRGTGRRCWSVAGRVIDPAIATLFLGAVQIPEIELAFAVARETERQAKDVDQQWSLRRERLTYEARLAERRYKAVDPDNRAIARTLEREWNEKLEELDRLEGEYKAARHRQKLDLSEEDHARILALAHDLPGVWNAPTTTHAERKNLLRVLVNEVLLSPVDAQTRSTRVQVLWQTGAVSEILVERPQHFTPVTTPEDVIERIRALVAAGKSYSKIAEDLNRRQLGTAHGHTWDRKSVYAVATGYGCGLSRRRAHIAIPNLSAARTGCTPLVGSRRALGSGSRSSTTGCGKAASAVGLGSAQVARGGLTSIPPPCDA